VLVLATRSPGKLRELQALFRRAGVEVIDLRRAGIPESADEEGLENADTFEDNALSKARYFQRLTDLPVVADDSGLEVVALDGAPGVHSKRWSGRADLTGQALDDANNAWLLARLAQHADRRARYVCAAAYCDAGGAFVERGETRGRIRATPEGTNGFGYDPYFESDELGSTFGEVSLEEKSRVSHRARAFAKLLQRLTSQR
jgi:XTP/dITP diphosphohydrolase